MYSHGFTTVIIVYSISCSGSLNKGGVPLYSHGFTTVIIVYSISSSGSLTKQGSLVFTRVYYSYYCLQYLMFRFSKQGRVPLYSDRFSPVIFVPDISRDLSVLPQS